ncbi:hypothetical protein QUF64_00200 [Anaerolineales bacterium HSG6]|nr:hypothetical protein [Anaerolineales bacterium HSG6]
MSSQKKQFLTILLVLTLLVGSAASTFAAPAFQDEVTPSTEGETETTEGETTETEGEATETTETEGEATETTETEGEATETTETEGEATETTETEGEATETTETEGEATETTETEGEATETTETEGEATETTETEGEATETTETEGETATTEGEATETAETEGEAATTEGEATETAETETAEMVDGCKAYTVVSGDSLGGIAAAELGDGNAYQIIVDATNEAAAAGDEYAAIEDADFLSLGQVLCIPTATPADEAEATVEGETMAATEGTTDTVETAIEEIPAMSTNQVIVEDVEIPEGKIALLFENLSTADFIVDIIGPSVMDAQLVLPTQKVVFVLEQGSYKINAHSPGGGFGFTGATFDAGIGQWAELIAYGGTSQLNVKDLDTQPATEIIDDTTEEVATEEATTEEATEEATEEVATEEATTEEATEEVATEEATTEEATEETATEEATTEEATEETATEEATTEEATEETVTEEATTEEATEETAIEDTGSTDINSSFAPNEGQGRIYFQNLYTGEFNVDLGDGSGAIAVSPAVENMFRDVAPGSYNPGLSLPGGGATNLQFEVTANTSWVIILLEDGRVGAVQIYPQQ